VVNFYNQRFRMNLTVKEKNATDRFSEQFGVLSCPCANTPAPTDNKIAIMAKGDVANEKLHG
jgi:hypothetical protein